MRIAVPDLTKVLAESSSSVDVKGRALFALAYVGGKEAVGVIYRVLAEEKDPKVRGKAALYLGNPRDKSSIPYLRRALKDVFEVRCRAAITLITAFGDFSGVDALVKDIDKTSGRLRKSAVSALGCIKNDKRIEPLLLKIVKQRQSGRESACSALGRLRSKAAVPALMQIVTDVREGDAVRRAAIQALAEIKDPRAVPAITKALKEPQLDHVAAWALSQIPGAEDAAASLIELLKDPQRRNYAAASLAKIGAPQAAPALVELLKDGRLRKIACRGLKRINRERVVDLVIPLLREEDGKTRAAAASVLRHHTGQIYGSRNAELWERWWKGNRAEYLEHPNLPYPAVGEEFEKRARPLLEQLKAGKASKELHAEISALGPAVIPLLWKIVMLERGDGSLYFRDKYRWSLLDTLKRLGPAGMEECKRIFALDDYAFSYKRNSLVDGAARILVEADKKAAADFFLEQVAHGDNRTEAMRWLLRYAYKEQSAKLHRILAEEQEPKLKPTMARLVLKFEGAAAVPFVVEIAKNETDEEARLGLCRRIAIMDKKTAVPLYRDLIQEAKSFSIRFQAVSDVGSRGMSELKPLIARIAREDDGGVGLEAAQSLARLGEPGASKLIARFLASADKTIKRRAGAYLAKWPHRSCLPEILAMLDDSDARTRRYALEAIRKLGE
ncbi:MAG: HEAT repeat domain-containing protein, partial [Phycisphaerae bacterium]|nr:HEAT repeat domain-containing protein [Phycisphaerae bacterium]